jgi:hypothetical protein
MEEIDKNSPIYSIMEGPGEGPYTSTLKWGNRLIIGLGKMGSNLVNAAAKKVERTRQFPENTQFVVVDADMKNERIEISHGFTKINMDSSYDKIRNENQWLPLGSFPAGDIIYRCFGKALYKTNRSCILNHIGRTADSLFSSTRNSNLFIVLVTHFGDGIGSSIITELAVELYKRLDQHYNLFFTGIGILPDQKNQNTEELANAHATIKELHFLMSQEESQSLHGDFMNPFSIFFLVSGETNRTPRGNESTLIVDFLSDAAFFPDTFLNELQEKAKNHCHQFSSFGHFRCQFPIQNLHHYYELESIISSKEREARDTENQLSEAERELERMESTLSEVINQINNLDETITSEEKKVLSFVHKDEIKKIENQKTRVLQERRDIEQKVKQSREKITTLKQKKTEIMQESISLKSQKDHFFSDFANPENSIQLYTIGLHPSDIERLHKGRDLEFSCMLDIMQRLNREEEFYQKTHEHNANNIIIPAPLLNYTIHYDSNDFKETLPEKLIHALSDSNLLTVTPEGIMNIRDTEEEDALVFTMTFKGNYDNERLSFWFDDMSLNEFTVKSVALEENKRFCFDIYYFLIGLRPWSPLPDELPPRLKSLTFTQRAYEREVQGNRISRYHGLLGIPGFKTAARMKPDDVLRFWLTHEIVNEDAQIFYLSVLLHNFVIFVQGMHDCCQRREESFKLLQMPENSGAHRIGFLQNRVDTFENYCESFKKLLEQNRGDLDRYLSRLRDHYDRIGKSREALNMYTFPEKIIRLEKEFDSILNDIKKMQDFFNESFYTYIENIETMVDTSRGSDSDLQSIGAVKQKLGKIKKESAEISIFLEKLRHSIHATVPLIHEILSV